MKKLLLLSCLLALGLAAQAEPVKVKTPALPDTVTVTATGHSFHKPSHNLAGAVLVLRVDAEEAGFVPCKTCFADRKKTASLPFERLRRILTPAK